MRQTLSESSKRTSSTSTTRLPIVIPDRLAIFKRAKLFQSVHQPHLSAVRQFSMITQSVPAKQLQWPEIETPATSLRTPREVRKFAEAGSRSKIQLDSPSWLHLCVGVKFW